MIPGPRPAKGHASPPARREAELVAPELPVPGHQMGDAGGTPDRLDAPGAPSDAPRVALTRTGQGWSVISPAGIDGVGDLVEGLSLADLVAEELGMLTEPDRATRRSARGSSPAVEDGGSATDARVAALERTVTQLEHALAARVSTERAIGVLAERHATSARVAFETLRQDARSQGRPVAELAREVLDGLSRDGRQEEQPGEGGPEAPPAGGAAPGRAMPAQRHRRRTATAAVPPPPGPPVLPDSAGSPAPDGGS